MPETFRLVWPVDSRRVNQFFGENPDTYKPFNLPGHEGLDLFAPANANVYAAAAGEVYEVGQPPNHPYGLHIRIKHVVEGQTYRTIYAHLARALVSVGQQVAAGERIGQADNSGNSFGDHLHLTLKIDGAKTPGYPDGIVDPWPFLKEATETEPPASDLVVYTTDKLNLRAGPGLGAAVKTILGEAVPLTVLGDSEAARARLGKPDEFIQVKSAAGVTGFVSAFYLRLTGQTPPASDLTVFPTERLNVRAMPSTEANLLAVVGEGDPLTVLGDAARARARIGKVGEWLNVRAPSGHAGYVAAWLVGLEPPAAGRGQRGSDPATETGLTIFATDNVNIRAKPTVLSAKVGGAFFNQPLAVAEADEPAARAKVGKKGQWLQVRTDEGGTGFVAAEFVSLQKV
jgi:uncharacterized protein YgiM (DUF1202 family)